MRPQSVFAGIPGTVSAFMLLAAITSLVTLTPPASAAPDAASASPAPTAGRAEAAPGASTVPRARTETRAAAGQSAASRLTALYTIADVSESEESVLLTFSFTLHNPGPDPFAFDKAVLANLADADAPWAGFEGGTVPAKGSVDRVAGVTVSLDEYRKWQSGAHPALFVYTHSEKENLIRTRIRAVPAPK